MILGLFLRSKFALMLELLCLRNWNLPSDDLHSRERRQKCRRSTSSPRWVGSRPRAWGIAGCDTAAARSSPPGSPCTPRTSSTSDPPTSPGTIVVEELVLRDLVITNSLECKMLCAVVERGRRCRRSKDTWINKNSTNVNFLSIDMLTSQRCSSCSCRGRKAPCSSCWWRSWRGWSTLSRRCRCCTRPPSCGAPVDYRWYNRSHLDVVGVDLGPRQHVERAVVRAAREDTSSAVVAAK